MATYVAVLRSVNVGGHNRIKMPVLEGLFADLGYSGVVTYIQSGNGVFGSRSKNAAAITRNIEECITRELGFDVAVLLRTKEELTAVVRANPFLRAGADPGKLHVTFLTGAPPAALALAVEEFDAGADEARVVGREVYLHCPSGYGNTKLNGAFVERRLKTVATTRNWNTVTKLVELAG